MKSLDFIRLREAPATTAPATVSAPAATPANTSIKSTTSATLSGVNPYDHPNYQTYYQQELAKNNRSKTPTGQQIAEKAAVLRVQKELAQAKSGEQISVNGAAPVQVRSIQAAQAPAAPEIVPPGFVPASSTPPAQTITYNAAATQPVAPQPTIQSQPTAPDNQPVPGTAPAPADPNSGGEMTSAAPAGITAAGGATAAPTTGGVRAPVASAPGEGPTGVALAKLGVSKQDRLNQQFVNTHLGPGFKAGSAQANTALLAHFQKQAARPAAPAAAAPAVQDPRAGQAESIAKKQPVLEFKMMTAAEKMAHFRNIIMEAPPRGNPTLGSALNQPAATPSTSASSILGPNGQPINPSPGATTPLGTSPQPQGSQYNINAKTVNIYNTLPPDIQASINASTNQAQAAASNVSKWARALNLAKKFTPGKKTLIGIGIAGAAYGAYKAYNYLSKPKEEVIADISTMVTETTKAVREAGNAIQADTNAVKIEAQINEYLKDVTAITSDVSKWNEYFGDKPTKSPEQQSAMAARIVCVSNFYSKFSLPEKLSAIQVTAKWNYLEFLQEAYVNTLKSQCAPLAPTTQATPTTPTTEPSR